MVSKEESVFVNFLPFQLLMSNLKTQDEKYNEVNILPLKLSIKNCSRVEIFSKILKFVLHILPLKFQNFKTKQRKIYQILSYVCLLTGVNHLFYNLLFKI